MKRVTFRQNETARGRAVQAAAIFLAALALRLMAVQALGDLPISRTPQLDSAAYLAWARALLEHILYWPPYPEHAPGYPLFMAGILALGGSLTTVRVVQALLGAIGCVLTARIASRTLTPKAFLPAGLLQAAYGPLIYIDSSLLAESLFVFLLILALDLATSAETRRRWLICGIVLGAAIVVRPTALVVVAAFAIVMALRMKRRVALRFAVSLAAGAAVVVAPIVLQNWRVTGVPMVQAYGGMNVYLGNRPSGDGAARARLGGEWDRLEGEASRTGTTRNDQDAYYLRRTLEEISAQPAAYTRLLGIKLMWTLQDEELRDTHSYYFFREALPMLRWLPSFGFVLALAAAGMLTARDPRRRWLYAYIAAMLATTVFLVVGTRYRMPLVPALVAFAGAGIANTFDHLRARDWHRGGPLLAAVVVVFTLSQSRTDAASRNLAEEWAFTGLSLLQENRIEEAEAAYRHAIGRDDSSFAWDGLGLVLQRRELRTAARDAFERAVRINPENATAWLHLGLAYEFLGHRPAALEAYRRALAIMPERTEAKQLLQEALGRRQGP